MLKKQIIFFSLLMVGLEAMVLGQSAIKLIKVQYKNYQPKIISTGSLIAIPGIIVKPEVSGRITKIYFKSGEKVTAGTPLIEINADILKPQLTQMLAQLNLEQLQFNRAVKLYQKHFVSKSDLDIAKTNLMIDKAKVNQMKAELKQMTVTAPFSGTLGLSMISLGDYVEKGQGIVKLNQLDPIDVDFSLPEIDLTKIIVGQTVLLSSDAYPHQVFEGKIIACESAIDPSNRTIMARASIPNKNKMLRPGIFVKVTLFIGEPKKVMVIPQTAIIHSTDGDYVYKIINDKTTKVRLKLGGNNGNIVIVNSGLQINDQIIASGNLKISYVGAPLVGARIK